MESTESIITDGKKARKILSQEDAAAVLIRSAYKGFEVRRSQPLEKLRKVHQIRQQIEVAKNKIQMFESSSTDQDLKHKVAASETIMNLMLQLDTIQVCDPTPIFTWCLSFCND